MTCNQKDTCLEPASLTKRVRRARKRTSAFTLIVSFVCLSLVGLAVVPLLPVKLNPSRSLPGFTVEFALPGTSSRVVEMEVTSKLESMLARISGIKKMESVSGNGWGNITVELDKHADVDAARFEASTIVRQTWSEFPEGTSYPVIRMKMPDEQSQQPFMTFTLNAPATPVLIQQYAEEHIKPKLARLDGIYKIELSGATPMEWRLEYDSEQLSRLGVSIRDIQNAIQQYYRREFLGMHHIDNGLGSRQWIRLALLPAFDGDAFDASIISMTTPTGKLLRLDQLVTVNRVEEEPQSYFRINGLNSIYLSITAEETVNQLSLRTTVNREMQAVAQLLPSGYEIHVSYDATEYIREELDKIYFRTGLTVIILLLFVWLMTRRLKYLFLIVASLCVNISVAFILYYLLGVELQLYSLAGITISLNLVIDSTIVMADHIMHRHNMKAFLSVLAATLTTVGALVIIFFLDENIRLNLQDFAVVVIVNLAVSLIVSLFFVPALIEKMKLEEKRNKTQFGWIRKLSARLHFRPKSLVVKFSHCYGALIGLLCRWKWVACMLLILGFGLPVFLLPDKLEREGKWQEWYNRTFGSAVYREDVKPIVDTVLGGALRLFVQKVYEGSYFTRNDEVVLYANANLPNGSTLEQMNVLVKRMETYLSGFKEIRQFHTSIYSPRRATIAVYFKKEYQNGGFPYTLKSNMITKALQLGGGSWNIYGLQDQGFSNDVRESAGTYRITMRGYNYEELYSWAEKLKSKLLTHRRIKEVLINSQYSWWKDDYQEFYFKLDRNRMVQEGVDAQQLFAVVQPMFGRNIEVGIVATEAGIEYIRLSSRQSKEYDVWKMQFFPYGGEDGRLYKLSDLATVEKGQMPQEIVKEDQQYRLCLQYEYIGSSEMGKRIQRQDLEDFNRQLPMGYTAEGENSYWGWGQNNHRQYLLLLVVIAIIFFITSILFNSLKQPLAILFVIPVSYIGVFLTFYWFGLNFDQGGFASFVLLCGITVNASIYILNEYNNLRIMFPHLNVLRAYIKAWNSKVIPISLTIVSTILGFIPFMIGNEKEGFWFPLAAGTIGGLIMSVIGVFFFLPIFVLNKKDDCNL